MTSNATSLGLQQHEEHADRWRREPREGSVVVPLTDESSEAGLPRRDECGPHQQEEGGFEERRERRVAGDAHAFE